MANRNKILHLGIIFMFITLAAGSRILDQKNNSSNSSGSNNKGGNLGLEESQNKKGEKSGAQVFTPPKIDNNTVGAITKNNTSTEGLKQPDEVKNEGSQNGNGTNIENGPPPKKKNSKTIKTEDLGNNTTETGKNPEKNLVPPKQDLLPPKQNLVPPVDNNVTLTNPPAKKEIEPPPVEGHKENSDDTVAVGDKEKEKEKSETKPNKDSRNEPVCDEAHSCTDKKNIVVACLRAPGNEMQELSLLIQNKGEEVLHVSINAPAFLKIDPSNSTLDKQKNKLVQVSMVDPVPRNASLYKIVINVDDGECILGVPNQYVNLSYKQRFFDGFSYSAIVTPMFGMYLLLFTVLAIAGSWLCCKLRGKRRLSDGIRYQELEMTLPETNLSTNGGKLESESIDGWDEWDDTWEDAETGRSSTRPIQTVSSNGLASRRSNKDGWDNSWDD